MNSKHIPFFSVIIPALNEQEYIAETLLHLANAIENFSEIGKEVEVIVANNASTDNTADIAREYGARVIYEGTPGIAKARNAGAKASSGRFLFFLDADTVVPKILFKRVYQAILSGSCIGGAISTDYRPRKRIIRLHVRAWAVVARLLNMAQGIAQFVERDTFETLGGYDTELFMSEDTDFYWRLQKYAHMIDAKVLYITDIAVIPSCRRIDKWPAWKTLLWTNPVTTILLLRSKNFWRHWYENPPR